MCAGLLLWRPFPATRAESATGLVVYRLVQ